MEELERWVKIEKLIEQSLALPPEKRSAFLKHECGTDEGLRTEIESLLFYNNKADAFVRNISENVVSDTFEELLEIRLSFNKEDELQIIGQNVAHYKVMDKLGNGGMGVVYKAIDTKLKRTVALKFLLPRFLRTENLKQLLILEAQATAALNHPNICTIYQINEYDGMQFIVMEFIDGVTMREKLTINDSNFGVQENRTLKLNIETTIGYSIQIAEALQDAHEKKVIHCDIKPENIIVDSKNRIKVTDFGLAKLIGTGDLTKFRSALGSLAYMSPEQIQNRTVDRRSDIFSFGVVLYEMLTGLHPFRSEKDLDTIHSIVNKDPAPLSELLPEKSATLADLVNRMLEKDPNNRYQSSHLLVNDLKRCSETLTIPVETTDASPYSVRFRAKILSSAAILALILFAGYWFWLPGSEPATGNLHHSVAVLALENLSPAPDDAYFAEVIHEEMINLLAGIRSFTVISRSSITGYPTEERDLRQIGRDFGVSTVMEGNVQRTGERLTLSMQLIDTGNLEILWSGSFVDHADNIYKIQSHIAREVTEVLEAALTPDE
jgi:eukaryotic-like serine/threonine-protein kinase